MSPLIRIAPLVPHMRRLGKSITEDGAKSDDILRSILLDLSAGNLFFDDEIDRRVALYKIYVARIRLSGLLRASFSGYLLQYLHRFEGFDIKDSAYILDVDELEAAELITKEIEREDRERTEYLARDILIIDSDDPSALVAALKERHHRITGIATIRAEVSRLLNRKTNLIIADVRLSDGITGVAAVREVLMCWDAPVIFHTANTSYLSREGRIHPRFLLEKRNGVDECINTVERIATDMEFNQYKKTWVDYC